MKILSCSLRTAVQDLNLLHLWTHTELPCDIFKFLSHSDKQFHLLSNLTLKKKSLILLLHTIIRFLGVCKPV